MTDTINETGSQPWERAIIEKMFMESLQEQRRSRRWKVFFRLTFLIIAVFFFALIYSWPPVSTQAHTAMIDIRGLISSETGASADNIIKGLKNAFTDKMTKGIILRIDSGGGSPVQAGEVYNALLSYRKKYPDIKVYAVCTDACASGAYYIAAAADAIYADKASIVGSVGVVMRGFGFVDTLVKVGAERRLFTSGSDKGFLDPFLPLKEDEVKHMQSMLDNIHQQFIDSVKKERGSKLKEDPLLFSGLIWTGEQALPLGLIDGLATPTEVAENIIKEDTIVDYTEGGGLLRMITDNATSSFVGHVVEALQVKFSH
jgi:protease IV